MTPTFLASIALAIAAVETGDNPHRLGLNGETGPMQISAACLRDVNAMQDEIEFTAADTLDPIRARAIFMIYVSHYCTAERLGHEPTVRDYALCWNAGPYGMLMPSPRAMDYAERVENLVRDSRATAGKAHQ